MGLNTGNKSYTIVRFCRLMRLSGMLPLRELFCRRLENKTELNYVVSTHITGNERICFPHIHFLQSIHPAEKTQHRAIHSTPVIRKDTVDDTQSVSLGRVRGGERTYILIILPLALQEMPYLVFGHDIFCSLSIMKGVRADQPLLMFFNRATE